MYEKTYKKFAKDIINAFLRDCGVQDYAWIMEKVSNFSEEYLSNLRYSSIYKDRSISSWHDENVKDYTLEGIDDFLNQPLISKDDSLLLFNILIKSLNRESDNQKFYRGKYQWFYYSPKSTYFESYLVKKLKTVPWLYQKNIDSPQCPEKIMLSNLEDIYPIHSEEASLLLEKLNFISEIEDQFLQQLSAEKRRKYLMYDQLDLLSRERGINLEMMVEELKLQQQESDEEQDDIILPLINEQNPEIEDLEDYSNSGIEAKIVGTGVPTNDEKNSETDNFRKENFSSDSNRQDTSDSPHEINHDLNNKTSIRGEQLIFIELKKRWKRKASLVSEDQFHILFRDKSGNDIELHHLNEAGKTGVGCDILVKMNNENYEYIEGYL